MTKKEKYHWAVFKKGKIVHNYCGLAVYSKRKEAFRECDSVLSEEVHKIKISLVKR